jgi:lipopolysaccharide export system permease protein
VLLNGRRYEGTPGSLDYRTVDFDRYAIRIEPKEAKRQAPRTSAMNTLDLLTRGSPTSSPKSTGGSACPIAVVLMGLLAIPLSFVNPRSGRSWNLAFAVLTYALYYNSLSVFQAYTVQGKVPGWLGLWPVTCVMAAIIAYLYYRQLYGSRLPAFTR